MNRRRQLEEYLAREGLKMTRQREIILAAFLQAGSHLSTEELYLRLRHEHPGIGYATVHRTLKLFAECGLAETCQFGDGQTRYEPANATAHHDHLICTGCGLILEFEDSEIEALQGKVAAAKGFVIRSHRLDLFGLCASCQATSV